MTEKPLNAMIAEALGWRTWEDPKPGREGTWFQERDNKEKPEMTDMIVWCSCSHWGMFAFIKANVEFLEFGIGL